MDKVPLLKAANRMQTAVIFFVYHGGTQRLIRAGFKTEKGISKCRDRSPHDLFPIRFTEIHRNATKLTINLNVKRLSHHKKPP